MNNRENSYIDQRWTLEAIVDEKIRTHSSWEDLFVNNKEELKKISNYLDNEEKRNGMYYPFKKDIFAAFDYTPLNNVKVVIIGQDPYPQTITIAGQRVPRATGLAFSVRPEDSIPSSLKNIYIELANTVVGFTIPDHGDLTEWTKQGVLLLNTSLTVQPGKPKSHGIVWLEFIKSVFAEIDKVNPYCIYMMWGREAQKLKPRIGSHSIPLEAAHPSGLSARSGFFGCNHFNIANNILQQLGKETINWHITPLHQSQQPHLSQNNLSQNNLSQNNLSQPYLSQNNLSQNNLSTKTSNIRLNILH